MQLMPGTILKVSIILQYRETLGTVSTGLIALMVRTDWLTTIATCIQFNLFTTAIDWIYHSVASKSNQQFPEIVAQHLSAKVPWLFDKRELGKILLDTENDSHFMEYGVFKMNPQSIDPLIIEMMWSIHWGSHNMCNKPNKTNRYNMAKKTKKNEILIGCHHFADCKNCKQCKAYGSCFSKMHSTWE